MYADFIQADFLLRHGYEAARHPCVTLRKINEWDPEIRAYANPSGPLLT